MKIHTVYFEIYGKKMRAKILAESAADAKTKIKEKIKFHKVVKDETDQFNQATNVYDYFKDILDIKD